VEVARERTKQASHVVAIATTTGVCGAGVLFFQPTWPVAVGVAALAAMAAVICYFVVTRP
jgi:uncharacterized membrane protein